MDLKKHFTKAAVYISRFWDRRLPYKNYATPEQFQAIKAKMEAEFEDIEITAPCKNIFGLHPDIRVICTGDTMYYKRAEEIDMLFLKMAKEEGIYVRGDVVPWSIKKNALKL